LSYEKVAEELGLQSPRVIYEWTNGNKLPSLVRLVNLAYLLGVHLEDLLETE
jgi:transcriptional regulator with XRE-family HTH domain